MPLDLIVTSPLQRAAATADALAAAHKGAARAADSRFAEMSFGCEHAYPPDPYMCMPGREHPKMLGTLGGVGWGGAG